MTNPEPQQSAAHRRGRPTRGKRPTGRIRIANVGERPGPTHPTLDSQRASIKRTARNNGNEIVDVLRDQDQSASSRNRPQIAIATQRILASDADAITGTAQRAEQEQPPHPSRPRGLLPPLTSTGPPGRPPQPPPKRSPRSAARSTPPGERSVAEALVAPKLAPPRKESPSQVIIAPVSGTLSPTGATAAPVCAPAIALRPWRRLGSPI